MEDNLKKLSQLFDMVTESITRTEFVEAFKALADFVKRAEERLIAKIDARMATWRDGVDGKNGRDGKDGVSIKGDKGDKGDRGEQGPIGRSLFGGRGEPGKDGKDAPPQTPEQLRDGLETLRDDERLDKSAIKGIEGIEKDIKEISIRPVGRGFGAKGVGLYVDGAKKLLTAQTLNFIAGTNVTLTYNFANGRNDITISATGGSGGGILAATGTVDGSNTSFVFASAPSIIIVDGVPRQKTQSDGTVNWTGTTSVTLAVAPNYDLYGIS